MTKVEIPSLYVVVYEVVNGDEKEAKRLGPMSQAKAERVDAGMQPNLNHDRFLTRIVEAE